MLAAKTESYTPDKASTREIMHTIAKKLRCEAHTKRSRMKLQCKRHAYQGAKTCKCHTTKHNIGGA